MPDNAVGIVSYGKHFFRNYFYAEDKFYYYTGVNYRIMPISQKSKNSYFIVAKDINNKNVKIYINIWDKIKGF